MSVSAGGGVQRREDQKRAEGTGKGTRSLTLGAMRENPEAWSCGEGARAKEMRETASAEATQARGG